LEHLALQQQSDTLWRIWECIQAQAYPGSSYIRAMLMRSFRYLDQMQAREVQLLLYRSLEMQGIDHVELLMATETLIYIGFEANAREVQRFLQQSRHFVDIEPRIARNFVILAGQSHQNLDYSIRDEYFGDIYSIAKSDNWERHRKETEPENIRKKFYHPFYSDGPDEFAGDYFSSQ
jgi:hypothetical protein